MELTADLLKRQLRLEEEMFSLGAQRYHSERPLPWSDKARKKEECELPPGKWLLMQALEPFTEAIRAFIEDAKDGKAGHKHSSLPYLRQVEPEQAAYLAARVIINHVAQQTSLQTVSRDIGRAIRDHLAWLKLREKEPFLYKRALRADLID